MVALLNQRREVTVAPADDIQAATRDIVTINRWKKEGKELVLLGIVLKRRTTAAGLPANDDNNGQSQGSHTHNVNADGQGREERIGCSRIS